MANSGLQLLGFALALLGWVGLVACTAIPQWQMSSYAGDNIITAQAMYKGLWMDCVTQSTGMMSCKMYDSVLALPGKAAGPTGRTRPGTRAPTPKGRQVWLPSRKGRFLTPTPSLHRYEFGPAIFIGWAGSALVILGGALLSCSCPGSESKSGYRAPHSYPKPNSAKEYV
ncbi:claudin-7 [Suricata suricatta]|uniref:claudin-7 n=1 Tax=Suricata suricatta TaxID=37032 RepID=UPI001155BAB8|nr:claudin-7 [Suricata suricatta]